MRISRSISPSALATFEKDREQYYFKYCCETRPDREPQSKPASVGSAFDAYVKSNLMADIFGQQCFDKLFESQVEPHNRDFAYTAGAYVMKAYTHSGAYLDLVNLIKGAKEAPQFEFDANTNLEGVPLFGKPDCRFVHKDGAHIILDWKVNGYCGKSGTSPSKGYAYCRDGVGWPEVSRSHGKSHSLYEPETFMGIQVNKFFMEQVSIDWADQLCMYAWMMGESVGSDKMIVCIDQIVGKGAGPNGLEDGLPLLRVANHRTRVSAEHQHGLIKRIVAMWDAIQTGHVFTELTEDENAAKCDELDKAAFSMVSDGTEEGDFFAKCAKPSTFYSAR